MLSTLLPGFDSQPSNHPQKTNKQITPKAIVWIYVFITDPYREVSKGEESQFCENIGLFPSPEVKENVLNQVCEDPGSHPVTSPISV